MTIPPRKSQGSLVTGDDYNRLLELIDSIQLRPSATTDIVSTNGGTSVEVKKNLLGSGTTQDARWG